VLRQVMLPVIDWDKCRSLNGVYMQLVKPENLCAGPLTGGKSICSGDSGGPLVCKQGDSWFQYGISNWLVSCTEPNQASVFASVFAFRSWIQEKTGSMYISVKYITGCSVR